MALLDGVKVKLRGREFTIPPLTLDAFERLWPKIEIIDAAPMLEKMATMREVVHAAMLENYPDMEMVDLRKLLDVSNIYRVFPAVMARTAEGKPVGEAKAP